MPYLSVFSADRRQGDKTKEILCNGRQDQRLIKKTIACREATQPSFIQSQYTEIDGEFLPKRVDTEAFEISQSLSGISSMNLDSAVQIWQLSFDESYNLSLISMFRNDEEG